MAFTVQAYCERGHLQTFVVSLEGLVEVHGCETCRTTSLKEEERRFVRATRRANREQKKLRKGLDRHGISAFLGGKSAYNELPEVSGSRGTEEGPENSVH
jgi:hypothetical protein